MTGAHIHKGNMKSIFKEKKVIVFTSLAAGVLLLVGAVVALAIRSSNNKGSTPSSGSLVQPKVLKLEEIKSMEEPRLDKGVKICRLNITFVRLVLPCLMLSFLIDQDGTLKFSTHG